MQGSADQRQLAEPAPLPASKPDVGWLILLCVGDRQNWLWVDKFVRGRTGPRVGRIGRVDGHEQRPGDGLERFGDRQLEGDWQ